jgi:ketopantoate reductase
MSIADYIVVSDLVLQLNYDIRASIPVMYKLTTLNQQMSIVHEIHDDIRQKLMHKLVYNLTG